ncbi:hypothetical protein [Ensifer sp. Root127]|uniref:hypothetical protein n=1 Tax=Ensifer sp. Root127 TaxID=1736440 RepID=UPI001FCD3820|nr:hypothetical protein [Ensifer sp. Root127]
MADFLDERRVAARSSLAKSCTVELRRDSLGAFPRYIGKPFRAPGAALGARRLRGLAMVFFVATGEVFQPGVIVPAIQHAQRRRVDFGNGDVKVGSAFLHVPNHKARSIRANAELGINRPDELRQFYGRHLAFGRNR